MSTLIAMANFAGLADEQGQFPGQEAAFMIDSIGTSWGALLGTSPVTTYIESAAGIEAGGRTGITSVVTAFLFFLCIFFAPILSSVPPWATGPVLIVVGAMMMKGVTKVSLFTQGATRLFQVPGLIALKGERYRRRLPELT
jgi:AGZA family xanthine/uracil permease-like MFS transporter